MGLDDKRGYSSEAQQGFKRWLNILEAPSQASSPVSKLEVIDIRDPGSRCNQS